MTKIRIVAPTVLALSLLASAPALAADFETTRAAQQAYVSALLGDGYSPASTCAAVARYYGMDCRVERDPCFLGGPCRDENRYIVTYGRGLEITYLATITIPEGPQ